jgi:ABC-type polysaccharide/polyol phosphate transport system ATPase subunit
MSSPSLKPQGTGRAIEVQDVSKRFVLRHNPQGDLKFRFLGVFQTRHREVREEFWALRHVSIGVDRGDAVALVGRNGSGKSTLLKLVAGLHEPTSGKILVSSGARIGTMIELGVGFHGELTGQENVFLNAAIHGLSRAEIVDLYPRVVAYSGLGSFMEVPLKNFSSGMHMRLGFAVAANLKPDILLIDEIFAVGDQDFQQQCMATLKQFQDGGGTILFVSHAPQSVKSICRRACLLDGGNLLFDGEVAAGLAQYTRLLAAGPRPGTSADGAAVSAGFRARPVHAALSEAELDVAWHRLAVGGHWAEAGAWGANLLRSHGLEPRHYAIEMGCGSLATAVHLLPFMDQSHYWGFDVDLGLYETGVHIESVRASIDVARGHFIVNNQFNLSESPHSYDYALSNSFFRRRDAAGVAACIAATVKKLGKGAPYFVSWLEPGAAAAGERVDGVPAPCAHDFALLARAADAAGADIARLDVAHPRGDSVAVITKR